MSADAAPDIRTASLAERVALLSGHGLWRTEAVDSVGVPSIMLADGPHGLRQVVGEDFGIEGSEPATCFPTASLLGATWDTELAGEVGAAIAKEARTDGVQVVLGPGVNIKRHPYCGRNFEYLSEDPLLSGRLAAAFVTGVQELGVGTSIKHYAANNQESHRMVVDVVVDERTLREIYFPAFEIAVRDAQPWTVMCAYNKLNGTYCAEHEWLLTTVLRDQWGFEGIVVTDWGANNDRVEGVRAGQDLEMPGNKGLHDRRVVKAVESGTLPERAVDACAQRIADLASKATTGAAGTPVDCDHDANHALARRVAAAGAVLLRNDPVDDAAVLPVSPGASIAVIGEFARTPRFQGTGSSKVNARQVDNALDAFRTATDAAGGSVRFAPGYRIGDDRSARLIAEAVDVATHADVAVVVVGLPDAYEAEGGDRAHLDLPRQHDDLVRAVAAANERTVVVLCNGAPVTMPWIADVGAVLEAYLGGQAGGSAIADLVLGAAEPGGRLAETFPLAASDNPSDANFPGDPHQVQYREGLYVGYRWFDTVGTEPLFPFGHGLSYTTWSITDVAASATTIEAGSPVTVSAAVTNTGERQGSQVVQVYCHDHESSVYRPDQELVGFAKVSLRAGASETVSIELDDRAFAFWDTSTGDWVVEPGSFVLRVGTSSRVIEATIEIEVTGPDTNVSEPDAVTATYARPTSTTTFDTAGFVALLGHAIPEPEPLHPFGRNTTIAEFGSSPIGRPIAWLVRVVTRRVAASGGADAGGLGPTLELAVNELPLRNLAAMSNGTVPLWAVDVLAAVASFTDPKRWRR